MSIVLVIQAVPQEALPYPMPALTNGRMTAVYCKVIVVKF